MGRFKSRKFIVTLLIFGSAGVLPPVFTKLGVPPEITQTVLGIISLVATAYLVANVKDPEPK